MNSHYQKYSIVAGLLATLLSTTVPSAHACMSMGPPGTRIEVASEEAIIVWDAPTHTEHFIRAANFETNAKDFGFLVPTPTVPKLRAVDRKVMDTLDAFTKPQVIETENRPILFGSLLLHRLISPIEDTHVKSMTLGAPHLVEVLSSQQVAGLDATTLEASDANALTQWLAAHGYPSQPELTAWLTPYVAKHWKITAFKVAKPNDYITGISLPLVDMAFTADRPFYPYREPAQPQEPVDTDTHRRLLRVYAFSTGRLEGSLDANEHRDWLGTTQWANAVPAPELASWSQQLGIVLPSKTWMTRFDDHSSPRPGAADLYFAQAEYQSPVIPSPVYWDKGWPIYVMIEPLVTFFGLAGIGVWIVLRRRRRVMRQAPA